MATTFQIEQQVSVSDRYARRVNPQWVRLLDLLQMNVRYETHGKGTTSVVP